MNTGFEQKSSPFDLVKWLVVLAILVGAVYFDTTGYLQELGLLYRVIFWVAIAAVTLGVVYTTTKGRAFFGLLGEANAERRRVVWPNKQERMQTTIIVMIVITIIAFILFLIDSGFDFLFKLILDSKLFI